MGSLQDPDNEFGGLRQYEYYQDTQTIKVNAQDSYDAYTSSNVEKLPAKLPKPASTKRHASAPTLQTTIYRCFPFGTLSIRQIQN